MNRRKLLSILALHGEKQSDLARLLNVERQAISRKIRGITQFKVSEMLIIKERYNLSNDEFVDIFFDKKVT